MAIWCQFLSVFLLLLSDLLMAAVPLWNCAQPEGTAAPCSFVSGTAGIALSASSPSKSTLPSPHSSVGHPFFSGVSHWVQLYQRELKGGRGEVGGFFTLGNFQLVWVGKGCPLPKSHSSCVRALIWSYSSGSVASTSQASRFPIQLGASHCY